ncbi:MAG: peptidoglycan-binding protein [Hyphomicrobiales bacterium]|nr:peptidoglycan-binding protein [Hyphomicrobiales bacterium]
MGALQARLVCLALIGITAAISYNALYLQNGRHPAPFSSDANGSAKAKRTITHAVPRRRPAPPARRKPAASVSRDTVRAIQRELGTRNYDPGPVDGVAGILTRGAIMAYQHDHELPTTGEASDAILEHIVLGRGGRTGAATPEETVALIKAVQQVLAQQGYAPGPIDGIVGEATRKAIEAFERERSLKVTGRISGKLLREIIRVTGVKLTEPSSS